MSNTELCKYYMGLLLNNDKMPSVAHTDIIPALNRHFHDQWTWEIADERFAMDNTVVCTTVTLYTPGRIYTGRSLCKIKDYETNHLAALLDACQSFIDTQTVQPQQPQPNPVNQQMTPDQIMNAINQQTNNIPQPNYQGQNGAMPNNNQVGTMTDTYQPNLQQNANMSSPVPPQPMNNQYQPQQNMNIDYDAPQDRYKGFSQRQIDRLNQFKKDFDIINDDMFGNYVNTWDKTLFSKQDIIPANVDGFLNWVENLGKMEC